MAVTARNHASVFFDRREAGRQLSQQLRQYANRDDVVVLALPRGGVPVGYEVADALGAPLDIYLVRKLGVPEHRELAMGAIASGGIRVLNEDVIRAYGVPPWAIDRVGREEQQELERRETIYREHRYGPARRVEPGSARARAPRWRCRPRARLTDQFDAIVHIDRTTAVEPLDRWSRHESDAAETYPFGV